MVQSPHGYRQREAGEDLNAAGTNPPRFFLGCLVDDAARLLELSHQAIQASEWFIQCDSPNAPGPSYFPDGVRLVKAPEGKTLEGLLTSPRIWTAAASASLPAPACRFVAAPESACDAGMNGFSPWR